MSVYVKPTTFLSVGRSKCDSLHQVQTNYQGQSKLLWARTDTKYAPSSEKGNQERLHQQCWRDVIVLQKFRFLPLFLLIGLQENVPRLH